MSQLAATLEALAINIDHIESINKLENLFLKWNSSINLSAARTLAEIDEHVRDSLHVVPHLRDAERVLDVGSGGGFPVAVAAICLPATTFTALEPTHKKHAFLRTAARELSLVNLEALAIRVEDHGVADYDAATSRATFDLAEWLSLGLTLVRPGGVAIGFEAARRDDLPLSIQRHPYVLDGKQRSIITVQRPIVMTKRQPPGPTRRQSPAPLWRPTKQQLAAATRKKIPDLIAPHLDVLFCGINPGLYSAAVGHHFARPGNQFWPTLFAAGFTPRLFNAFDEHELLGLRLGITNFVSRATAAADELDPDELRAGARLLVRKVKRYEPRYLAAVGLQAYRVAFDRPKAVVGLQPEPVGATLVWLLPNPSGLNAHHQPPTLKRMFGDLRAAALPLSASDPSSL